MLTITLPELLEQVPDLARRLARMAKMEKRNSGKMASPGALQRLKRVRQKRIILMGQEKGKIQPAKQE